MSLATTQDQRDLADAVRGFASRAADIAATRDSLAELTAGRRTDSWERLVAQELHAVHLPEPHGGGAGLTELAVVTEELAHALFPGPFLSTVIASATVAVAPPAGAREQALREFADGATGAVVGGHALVAVADGAGWRVSGISHPVSGLPGAEVVLVAARTADGREVWFRLHEAPSVEIVVRTGTDVTRSLGVLRLQDHVVGADDLLPVPPPVERELVAQTLYAAEASGVCRWLVGTAVEHARGRHQFGRPIGSFQAVQHKLAMMLVRSECATAAAWDAARAAGGAREQQALAAHQAALVAAPAAVDVAVECVSLLGAIGFTWEHDAHLYWRRAVEDAALVGPESRWAKRLGELSNDHRRDFALVADDALPDLRAEVGVVLDRALQEPDDDGVLTGWGPVRGGRRRAVLAAAGLVAPHYPAPYGRGAGAEQQAVIAQEFERRGLPQPTTVIGEWVLPTLLEHGDDAQRERFVPATLRGEIVWCQLFSEPGAGSDLAGLSTRARRVDGGWVLSGQKVWNSYAHEADWGVCLARTDVDTARHAGISYFLVDMRSAGVDVRPIRQATGRSEFNEVFLDEVFVPDDCLVGGPGQGWTLATTTLANERLNMGAVLGHGSSDQVRRAVADGTCAADPDEALRVLGTCVSREMTLAALALRGTVARLAGADQRATASVQKVFNALAQRDGSRALIGLLGPLGAVDDASTPYAVDHLGVPAVLFGGGTIEIQLNVIARRVLGLPGEPRNPATRESAPGTTAAERNAG
ncbi:MAG TPA: acyl-CoA dehydrogenase [Nocardioides sp.]|uniref:acyl-CoA dehydrogenase n=1 Tax=Nocardioides sp. TaxID=35761 RepID=UPI002B7291E0|nr:acyl-CoA dehydrogenase [Nocardioides sp.]HTW14016.1 acyl-CoA dehydrogenase [Nocardioides sp.]